MTTKEQTTTPEPVDLIEAGRQYMLTAGLDTSHIEPATVALAIHKPRRMKESLAESNRNYWKTLHDDIRSGKHDEKQLPPFDASETKLVNKSWELSRRMRLRRWAGGLAIGLIAGTGMAMFISEADSKPQSEETSETNGLMDTVTWDSSILPGELGEDTPFVHTLRELIPGTPDRLPYEATRQVTTERTTQNRVVHLSDSYDTADTINPASPDLSLTGEEYRLAREKAEDLVDSLGKPRRFTVTGFGADGRVSDEFGGKLGEINPEQLPLAEARGAVAAQALRDVLVEHGFEVPAEPVVTGHEVVLTPDEIEELQDDPQRLEARLARDRGAELQITGTRRTVRNEPRTHMVQTERTDTLSQVPNEVFPALMSMVALPVAVATTGKNRRGAHRAAKRELRRAIRRNDKGKAAA